MEAKTYGLRNRHSHLIRRLRDDLFALLSGRQASEGREDDSGHLMSAPSVSAYRRPEEIAKWSTANRQRWGELANQLEEEGLCWHEAERRACETIRAEREITGKIFQFVQEYREPDPFPEWDELMDPHDPRFNEAREWNALVRKGILA